MTVTKQNKHRNKTGIIISTDTSTLLLFYCNLTHYDGRDSTPTFISNNLLIGAIMNLFQKHQKTSGYKTIPDARAADEETTAVPFGTTVQTSTSRRSSTWRIANVAGMMMIVMAGGAILMLQTMDGGLMTTAVARIRDNLGLVCCKKQSDECGKHKGFAAALYCPSKVKGSGIKCHIGIGTQPDCCIKEDQGTFGFFTCN